MLRIACFCLVIAASMPVWSQVQPDATGGGLDDSHMMTPPPVSGDAYPVSIGLESGRSNYLTGGIVVSGAYNDNIMAGGQTQKIGDANYSVGPAITFNRRTGRQAVLLSWSTGFTVYQKSSDLNGVTQDGTAAYSLHLSPYVIVHASDTIHQNNNLFNQSNPFIGGGVSGGTPSPNSVYLYPFQKQFGNSLGGDIEYQYGRNAMVGGGGNYSVLRYSNITNNTGLDNSNVGGGSAFWNRRLTRGQYAGARYEFSTVRTFPLRSTTETHAVFGFYTMYLTRSVSLSILGGPQHYSSHDPILGLDSASWTPAIQGSAGYQRERTNFAASYSHIVSNVGGLQGAYHSNVASLTAQRQVTRTWNMSASGMYALFKSLTPVVSTFNPGGRTIAGTISAHRSFTEHFALDVGYSRFHQSYSTVGTGTLFPDSNREFVSVSYQFSRPIGQ